jgi:uncharacterized protein
MRVHWIFASLAVATTAGLALIVGRGDLARLFPRDDAPNSNAVDDRAAVLEPAERGRIAAYHAAILAAHDIDYRVLAIAAAGDLERTAHGYFAEAGVGTLSANGRGLLLVIDPALERVRLEVSTSLEGVYTDAFVAYVQNRQMAPFFSAGRVADGILATTELIVGRAQEARADGALAAPMPARSMGGGASAAVSIGGARNPGEQVEQQTQRFEVDGLEPLQVVEAYHERMASRDARADLRLYSTDTVAMLRHWVITPAQMDNLAKTYRSCTVDGVHIRGDAAVVRYLVGLRECAPYFLRRESDAWKLDLAALSSAIRFNHENQWHFQLPLPDDYEFAFEDWRIDRNGFPHTLR